MKIIECILSRSSKSFCGIKFVHRNGFFIYFLMVYYCDQSTLRSYLGEKGFIFALGYFICVFVTFTGVRVQCGREVMVVRLWRKLSYCICIQESNKNKSCSIIYLSSFCSVYDSNPWDSVIHIYTESSYFNQPYLEMHKEIWRKFVSWVILNPVIENQYKLWLTAKYLTY